MGNWSQISDLDHFQTQRLDGTNGSFPTGARTFDEQFHFLQTHLLGYFNGLFSCHTGSERCALAGTLKTSRTGTAPGNRVALQICYGNDGVIKGRKNVHLTC